MLSAESVAALCLTDPTVAAAVQFDTGATPVALVEAAASPTHTGTDDAAADIPSRFVLDVEAFMNDIEPLPAFLVAPSQQYLTATEIYPVLQTLAGH